MQRFWLDASVFIQAKRKYYPFDIVPGFWAILEEKGESQVIKSPYEVFLELAKGGDELYRWAQERRERNFFIEPDEHVQQVFREIADFVNEAYQEPAAKYFLDGADPWVIAHAKCDGGTVVTNEKAVAADSFKVKIPNICRQFEVDCVDTFDMLRELGASFVLG
jgi:hypothetical protein